MRFALDQRSGVPIYRQIRDQVRFGLASGQLRPGEQLPTVRALSVELAVNPNTVIKAYTELEREGIVTSEQGTGTFVSLQPDSPITDEQRREKLRAMCLEFVGHAGAHGFSLKEIAQEIRQLGERRR